MTKWEKVSEEVAVGSKEYNDPWTVATTRVSRSGDNATAQTPATDCFLCSSSKMINYFVLNPTF